MQRQQWFGTCRAYRCAVEQDHWLIPGTDPAAMDLVGGGLRIESFDH